MKTSPPIEDILDFITKNAQRMGLNAELHIRQCMTESSFQVDANNARTDCYGLFQLSKIGVKDLELRCKLKIDRYDWRQNVLGGLTLMKRLLRDFGGDMEKALAAYNWGSGHLTETIREWNGAWRLHLPLETDLYIKKITRLS